MSKGKTAICVCAMIASCVTGSVLIADSAMSGHTVGKMNNQEVFKFDNQQLSNAMPTFTTPIGETTETIKADNECYTQTVPAVISNYVAETTTREIKTLHTETNITENFFTEQAVTTTVASDSEESFTEVVTTANTIAVTTKTTTTASSSQEVTTTTTTTTTVATTPETTTTSSELSVPSDWFFMETKPVQVMETEPVSTEPVITTTTTSVYVEPVTETTTSTPVHTEPVTETTTTTTTVYIEPVTETTTTTVYTEPVVTEPVYTEPATTNYISESDYILLCNAVAHEAGSDWIDIYSKANVVEVIMNRVNSPLFPNTIYEVLSQPYQFEGSETYTNLGYYSYEVTDSVKSAVDLYFSETSSFGHGYLFFYGDGYQNHFSVAQ